MDFESREYLPGVHHIRDELGVCMTLLEGEREALLVDTGYGLKDLAAFVHRLTAKPVSVLLTHAHHDHALGARFFEQVFVFPEDLAVAAAYTGKETRRRVLENARGQGILIDEQAFLAGKLPPFLPLSEGVIHLGGMDAQIIRAGGHTPGSAVILVPQRSLLLTGDNWNPCTWMFFPESADVSAYRRLLGDMLKLPFSNELCPHCFSLCERAQMERFARGLTDEALSQARQTSTGEARGIRTARVDIPDGMWIEFDYDRYAESRRTAGGEGGEPA